MSVFDRAKQIDAERSAELLQKQSDVNRLAEWNAQVNDLRHLLDRDMNNLPTEFDVKLIENFIWFLQNRK
jgi:hypothetical protein